MNSDSVHLTDWAMCNPDRGPRSAFPASVVTQDASVLLRRGSQFAFALALAVRSGRLRHNRGRL
jgi:hypothetical protein